MSSSTQQQAVPVAAPCSQFQSCQCLVPDPSTHAWMGQPIRLLISHYDANCTGCYSCNWVRYAVHTHVPDPAYDGTMVPNKRNRMVSYEYLQGLRPEDRKVRPSVLYVYPKKVGRRPRWVVVPCQPFLPYLLREQDTTGIERFARLASGHWVGIKGKGQQNPLLDPDSSPPMTNDLYSRFGYGPGVSPYLPYGHRAYEKGLANGSWMQGFELQPPHVANGVAPWDSRYRPIAVDDDFNENNTTIFVGCLAEAATREDLKGAFGRFGEIADLRVFAPKPGSLVKNGFVYFFARRDAEMAMEQLQGLPIRGNRVRLSWGEAEDIEALRSRTACHVYPPPGQVHVFEDPDA